MSKRRNKMTNLKQRMKKVQVLALDIAYYARVSQNLPNDKTREKVVETLWSKYEELDRALTERIV